MDGADGWELLIPVGIDIFEGEAELVVIAWREGRGTDGFGIDVGLVGADEVERYGLDLRRLLGVVGEEYLDRCADDGASAGVADVAVDIGDLAAGEGAGFAHLDLGEGEACGIGVGREEGVGGRGFVMRGEEDSGDYEKDDEAGNAERKEGGTLGLLRGEEGRLLIGCHGTDFIVF